MLKRVFCPSALREQARTVSQSANPSFRLVSLRPRTVDERRLKSALGAYSYEATGRCLPHQDKVMIDIKTE